MDFNNIVKSTEVKAESSTSAKGINEEETCISLFATGEYIPALNADETREMTYEPTSFKTMYDRIDDGSLCKVGTHVSNLEPPTFKMMRDFWHSAMVFNCNMCLVVVQLKSPSIATICLDEPFQPTIVTDIVNNCDDFNNIVKSTEVKAGIICWSSYSVFWFYNY
jgi:hypothetical protein